MENFKNKKIAILGYGLEGKSLLSFLIKYDPSQIDVYDQKKVEDGAHGNYPNVSFIVAKISELDLNAYDFVFRSPGIKPNQINCPDEKVLTLTNLFLSLAKGKTIAVTGTKGKSTTVLLIAQILKNNQKKVFVGGNIGKSMLDFVDSLTDDSYSVLELSSFQLQDLKYSPTIAVILPIFPDHLDYHSDLEQYIEAKKRIFSCSADTKIVCAKENLELLALSGLENPIVVFFAKDMNDQQMELSKSCQIPAIDVAAAVSLADDEGLYIDYEALHSGFKKLPLRIERIGEVNNVEFFNDSASTNPISTQNAIDILDGKILLIMGGSSKGIDVEGLCEKISNNEKIHSVHLFGAEKERVEELLRKFNYDRELILSETLTDVFTNLILKNISKVLFSPAFASFDQYNNYKERGEQFNQLFKDLKCKNM